MIVTPLIHIKPHSVLWYCWIRNHSLAYKVWIPFRKTLSWSYSKKVSRWNKCRKQQQSFYKTIITWVWITAKLHASTIIRVHNATATNLSMSMLASFWSGHINDLASPVLQDNVAIFSKSRALLGCGFRSTGSCTFKLIVRLFWHDPTSTLQAHNHMLLWQHYDWRKFYYQYGPDWPKALLSVRLKPYHSPDGSTDHNP